MNIEDSRTTCSQKFAALLPGIVFEGQRSELQLVFVSGGDDDDYCYHCSTATAYHSVFYDFSRYDEDDQEEGRSAEGRRLWA